MKRFIIVSSIIALNSFACLAQQTNERDTLFFKANPIPAPVFSSPIFLQSLNLAPLNDNIFNSAFFKEPLFQETNWKIDTSILNKNIFAIELPINTFSTTGSPFISSFAILNQATYRLNNRFTIGGNSFAGNSIFNLKNPLNPSLNDMNVRGASFFMQYKVSPKVKIETRIVVNNNQIPPLP